MTKEGIALVLGVLKLNYPASYGGITKEERLALYSLWMYQFAEFSDEEIKNAVQSIIATSQSQFAPPIGQIKAMAMKLSQPEEMTEQEAWNIVRKAVKNCDMMNPEPEFLKLPDDLQRLVGNPQQLLDWGLMDTEKLHTVVASNFQRSYRDRMRQKKEYQALPQKVRVLIEQTKMKALEGA